MASEMTKRPERRYELDWLRVLVILNLIPFHAIWLMTFIPGFSQASREDWAFSFAKYYLSFFGYWHIPLLFFVAGTTSYISLNYRSATEYIRERIKRLFIPLIFFMLFVHPLPVYFLPGAADNRSISDYLTRFWPQCLKAPQDSWTVGRPALPGWGHLWFVGYLLLICLVTVPILLCCKKHMSRGWPDRSADLVRKMGWIFLPGISFVVVVVAFTPKWPMFHRHNLYQDWAYFFYNLVAFVWGFVFCLDERFGRAIDRYLRFSLPLAMVFSITVLILRLEVPALSTPAYSARYLPYAIIFGVNTWLWILALLGLARRYLSRSNAFLEYFSRASYPFYILHLTLMLPIGYYVVQLGLGPMAEFSALSVISFMAVIAAYELLIRRTKVTRFLFGMKC